MRKKIVSVIGGRQCTKEVEQIVINLGKKLAKVVDILIYVGLGGVMRQETVPCKVERGRYEGNLDVTRR